MNQVESRTLPDKETIRMEYDRMQNLSKILLPNGAQLLYLYDRRNRLEQIVLPTGGTIRYEYDPNGNRTGITDPEGTRTIMKETVSSVRPIRREPLQNTNTIQKATGSV